MKAHVERCSCINVKPIKTPNMSPSSKQNHNKLKSTSSPDAQSLFNMKENGSDRNAGKKQKHSAILVYYMLSVHHSLNIIQDMEMGVALINCFKMQFSAKVLTKKLSESRMLSKEDIDFPLLMALAFHGLPRKKSDLASLLRMLRMQYSNKVEYQVKAITCPKTPVYLMRLWPDGFQPYYVITLSVTDHAKQYST